MNNEKQTALTFLDACILLARETVSLLEGVDQLPDSAVSLYRALIQISGKQDLGDGGALLDWVNTEMENFKHFAETGEQTKSLVKLKTPLAMPVPDMRMDAVRLPAEMDDLEEMILDAKVPSGGFLSIQDLRTLLDSIQAAVEAKRQEAHVSPCEAAFPDEEALPRKNPDTPQRPPCGPVKAPAPQSPRHLNTKGMPGAFFVPSRASQTRKFNWR